MTFIIRYFKRMVPIGFILNLIQVLAFVGPAIAQSWDREFPPSGGIIVDELLKDSIYIEFDTGLVQIDGRNSIGCMLIDNPGKSISISFRDNTGKSIIQLNDRGLEMNNENTLEILFNNNAAENRSVIPRELILQGGGGSLDKVTNLTFLFVNGGGPEEYDWSEDTLTAIVNQSVSVVSDIIGRAYAYGIRLHIDMRFILLNIDYEPALMTNGREYYSLGEVNGLDPWRSATIGALGFESNLLGLLRSNVTFKGQKADAEGAICFYINLGNMTLHSNGDSPSWSTEWDESYYSSGGFCTVGVVKNDGSRKSVIARQLLRCFGAAGETAGDWHCDNPNPCNPASGKLMWPNNNCQYCGGSLPCVMKSITDWPNICPHTARQIGWLDSDGNGGGDVDDMPVIHHTRVTGSFDTGDRLAIYDLQGNLVNAMVISDYNSYSEDIGIRTVHILGLNYQRQIIPPGAYRLYVNGDLDRTININSGANHDPLILSNMGTYGPYFHFFTNNWGHLNLELYRPSTGEGVIPLAGHMAGGGWEYDLLFAGDWFPDGNYVFNAQTWACDGADWASSGNFTINYGTPPAWSLNTVTYSRSTDSVYAAWTANPYWTQNAKITAKGADAAIVPGSHPTWAGNMKWKNTVRRGSDSVVVQVRSLNPNGYALSNNKFYFTVPNPPIYIEFNPVYKNGEKINAIEIYCNSPGNQVLDKLDYYEVKYGHWTHLGGGYYGWEWRTHNINAEPFGGPAFDTLWNLSTHTNYLLNIRTWDIRDNYSAWGLANYDTVLTGKKYINPAEFPAEPVIPKESLPVTFILGQNYPNPFNPSTIIEFSLPQSENVNITIFNILGQKVTTLVDEAQAAGNYSVTWDGHDSDGSEVSSGVYFYRMTAGLFCASKTMMLVR